jgi:hypothetical protein
LLSFPPIYIPSSLLHYSYSLLGPRWLIVYATRFLRSSSPQTNTRLATCLNSLAPIAKPDWYPTPQEPRRECNEQAAADCRCNFTRWRARWCFWC